MSKTERRCPPYEGGDPYLYFCFAEKDSEAVFPLLEHLYQRGVRVWYSVKTTANIEKLNHQQIIREDYQPFGDGHAAARIVKAMEQTAV